MSRVFRRTRRCTLLLPARKEDAFASRGASPARSEGKRKKGQCSRKQRRRPDRNLYSTRRHFEHHSNLPRGYGESGENRTRSEAGSALAFSVGFRRRNDGLLLMVPPDRKNS